MNIYRVWNDATEETHAYDEDLSDGSLTGWYVDVKALKTVPGSVWHEPPFKE